MRISNITYPIYSKSNINSRNTKSYGRLPAQNKDVFFKSSSNIKTDRGTTPYSAKAARRIPVEPLKNIDSAIGDFSVLRDRAGIRYTKEQKMLARYLEEVRRRNRDRGLARVSGCETIKKELAENFVAKIIGREKAGMDINIPNAYLFYGPTGCGKTFFAQVLAEHTLSNVKIINATEKEAEDTFDVIKETAKKAAIDYEESGDKKTRTIIVINEADFLAYEGSPIIEELKDLMHSCADKYKCIIFLTTNYPLDIDKEILSTEITPYKTGIPYPTRDELGKIVKDKIAHAHRPRIDYDRFLDELFKTPGVYYSVKQIDAAIDRTINNITRPTTDDYIETLKQFPNPSVKQRDLDEYEKQKEILLPLSVNNL